jgi:hypothetical protein
MFGNRYSTEKKVNNVGDPINVNIVGSVSSPAYVTIVSNLGPAIHRAPITVTDTETQILIGLGKNTIEIFNMDTANDIYYGATGVDSSKGIPIFAGTGKIWSNVKTNFSVYLICSAGKTADVRIVEYS